MHTILQRTPHFNGVVTYQAPLFAAAGITHAFTTRIGGISTGPFASLNLGNPSNGATLDLTDNIRANYDLLQHALGIPNHLRAWVKQVHGNQAALVGWETEGEYSETLAAEIADRWSGQVEADALLTRVPNILLTIRIADCVPILLSSDDGSVVAAVHAGWRGVVKNVLARTVRAMGEEGIPANRVLAAIGPAISARHFEVGPEVVEEFQKADLTQAIHHDKGPKPHIDLPHALTLQLQRLQITRINTTPECTVENQRDFFSHRRDQGLTGRLAAVIAAKGHP